VLDKIGEPARSPQDIQWKRIERLAAALAAVEPVHGDVCALPVDRIPAQRDEVGAAQSVMVGEADHQIAS
jgi:hypothetical protein